MRSDPGLPSPARIARLRDPLLRWYRRNRRDLPWRRTRDPYAIWVSEIMLQQTTVAAVVPYWTQFLGRFPDVASLAASREDDVLAAWSGLGYYRRARSLREGAVAVMERHRGLIPGEVDDLLSLPGIGRYTAGAIASLAFGREAPVVDGNVKRVFSRLFALPGYGAAADRASWAIAGALVPGPDPGDLNQALMELGALVCTPRSPGCDRCPVRRWCRARALGTQQSYPSRRPTPPAREIRVAAAWIVRGGLVLLAARTDGDPLRGAWDLPAFALPNSTAPRKKLRAALEKRHRIASRVGEHLATVRHAILGSRLTIDLYAVTVSRALPRRSGLRWVDPARLSDVPHSGATKKIVKAVATAVQKRSHASRGTASGSRSSSGSRGLSKA
jgi:A/G-specific adenine glycosylase